MLTLLSSNEAFATALLSFRLQLPQCLSLPVLVPSHRPAPQHSSLVSAVYSACLRVGSVTTMRARGVAHTNGTAAASAPAQPEMPAHLAAMMTLDEVEPHIAHLNQRISALRSASHSSAAADRDALTAELSHAQLRHSAIRANGRYLALLSCGALLVIFIAFLLCGWQSPIVLFHQLLNSANQDRMARLGVSADMLEPARDDQPFVAAFDWWSWFLPHDDSGGKQRHT